MTTDVQADATWSALKDLDEAARADAMKERLAETSHLDGDELERTLQAMVMAEYELDDSVLHAFTVSRLRAWTTLGRSDMAAAKKIAEGYDAVFSKLPGDVAMRNASAVQTAARVDLTAEEIESLYELVPAIVRQIPRAKSDIVDTDIEELRRRAEQPEETSKPWWKFWG